MKLRIFERKQEKLASPEIFRKRAAASFLLATCGVMLVLFMGIAGYHWFAEFSWIDSLLEASMLLGGMGPIKELPNSGAKLFASFYALFSGLVFIAGMSIVLAPWVHRMLHKFHIDDKSDKD